MKELDIQKDEERWFKECVLLQKLAQYGKDGRYADAEVEIIARGEPKAFHYRDFRAKVYGKTVLDFRFDPNRKHIFSTRRDYRKHSPWTTVIERKILEFEKGFTPEAFIKLQDQHDADSKRIQELTEAVNALKEESKPKTEGNGEEKSVLLY